MKVFTIKDNNKMFPLTAAVGKGSSFNSYFVHIYPTKNSKNTYILIGKAVTYDSGGLNLKMQKMEEMKTDMTGSAILLSVLKLLNKNEHDNDSIHLLFPIVENMIGNNAIRPGVVVASLNNITVEITDTDAEGRLCIADALEYFTNYIKPKIDIKNTVLLDIATLTGNVANITGGLGGIIFCNNKGLVIKDKLIKIGNNIGEYLDFLHIRDEYKEFLKSSVADISNHNKDFKGGSVYAATFLNHFCDETIPWIHIDIGCTSFHNNCANSYGIYLLYQFIKKLN
jgi:leucyl aminopeptidase